MIPEPTADDFARDAQADYELVIGADPAMRTEARLAWIRLAEHYRIAREAAATERNELQKFKFYVHAWLDQLFAERDRLAARVAELESKR